MSENDVNIPLLRKAVEWAEAEAAKPWALSEWYQALWAVTPDGAVPSLEAMRDEGIRHDAKKSTDCGTCYCIAGYVASLEAERQVVQGMDVDLFDQDGRFMVPSEVAANALGLSAEQENSLFTATNTIEDIRCIAEEIAGESL